MSKEFVINDLLSARLNPETEKTELYVGGELFLQCKYILLINPNETIGKRINSIDEAAEQMSHILEKEVMPSELGITPLEEFQAHCSNLQAWAENDYDARLLHSNLAFPLLEALAYEGDSLAKVCFNRQVAARFSEGTLSTRQFILEQNYLEVFTDEELLMLYEDILCERDVEALRHLYKDRKGGVPIYSYSERRGFTENKGTIRTFNFELGDRRHLHLPNYDYERVAEAIFFLKDLRSLKFSSNYFTAIPERFGELKHLEKLEITDCQSVPESIGEIRRLKQLSIGRCKGGLPESVGKLNLLRTLIISDNQDFTSLPESIGDLTQLEELIIKRNPLLTCLPKSLRKLENVKVLQISGDNIKGIDLPERCPHLTELSLSGVLLDKIPEQVWNYRSLKRLGLTSQIDTLPESISNLKNLTELYISANSLKELPSCIKSLPLEYLSIDRNPLRNFPTFIFKMATLKMIYIDEEQLKKITEAHNFKEYTSSKSNRVTLMRKDL